MERKDLNKKVVRAYNLAKRKTKGGPYTLSEDEQAELNSLGAELNSVGLGSFLLRVQDFAGINLSSIRLL